MPMYILHDLHFEFEGLSAQIDYLIITKKVFIVIECKNLFGDIEINSEGDFIRTMDYGYGKKKEGIYSPITQNQRHLEMIKLMRSSIRGNVITKTLFEKNFYNSYKSLVVLANPKTILSMKYAKKEVKNQMLRCDQLIDNIKRLNNESKNEPNSDKEMLQLAEYFLSKHTPNMTDYTKKYQIEKQQLEDENKNEMNRENVDRLQTESDKERVVSLDKTTESEIENTPFYKALKEYRYKKSKEENIKAYYIFTNAQLAEIIQKTPATMADIKSILPYGDVKCAKYGDDILSIVKEHGIAE